ncbi:MAG: 30S ribosomal protein S6 [Candidatus Abawacabacteria bacterium RIFCSPHIGHO2_01_FULL_46_8]|uniref:Small ribosomal subunit protein bS6 n=1 Tax=Candidatus Abawacabacteria bacterium RIFCSPHIGHO2_01_FULL_46_8 TaxID=1817815 RepID=A0A1F4XM70_9BACT|nr:MAG: 30S ribosomal protein S6 [Candidatus Abawacabacteria bacterium RIFCSPHIGHO2_01_FULL_46_8]
MAKAAQTVTATVEQEEAEVTDTRRHYELLLILSPQLGDQEKQAVFKEWQKIVATEGGELTAEEVIGMRELAYPIRHFDFAYYCLFHFLIDPSAQKAIKKQLIVDTRLLRFMLVEIPAHYKLEIFDKDIVYGGKKVDTSAVAQALAKERKPVSKKTEQASKQATEPAATKPAAKPEPKAEPKTEPKTEPKAAKPELDAAVEAIVTAVEAEPEAETKTKATKPSVSKDALIKEEHEGAATEDQRMADLDEKLKELLG